MADYKKPTDLEHPQSEYARRMRDLIAREQQQIFPSEYDQRTASRIVSSVSHSRRSGRAKNHARTPLG